MSALDTAFEPEAGVGRFSVLNAPITIRSSEPSVLAAFRRLYALMPEASHVADAEDVHQVEIFERADGDCWDARADGMPERPGTTLGGALQRAEASCCNFAIRSARDLITVHAATIQSGEGLVLITGDSGAGKTTLTLTLAARGNAIDGDDIAMLNPETGLVCGLPRCFHLDDRSIELLHDQGLDVAAKESLPGFLTPTDLGDAGMKPRPVKALILLRPSDQSEPTVTRRPLSEAVITLDEQTGPRYRPSTEFYRHFARMLGGAAFFEVRRGLLDATATLVGKLIEEVGD